MFVKNQVSMPDLVFTKTHRKQIFWNLRWFQAGPHQKVVQSRSLKTKIHPWTPELWSILGCQPEIYVQPIFVAKPPTAQRILLFEVPSLRVILVHTDPTQKQINNKWTFFEIFFLRFKLIAIAFVRALLMFTIYNPLFFSAQNAWHGNLGLWF